MGVLGGVSKERCGQGRRGNIKISLVATSQFSSSEIMVY